MKIQPIDIEALEREKKPWNMYYVADVLSDLLSRHRGHEVHIHLTPKDPEELERRGR